MNRNRTSQRAATHAAATGNNTSTTTTPAPSGGIGRAVHNHQASGATGANVPRPPTHYTGSLQTFVHNPRTKDEKVKQQIKTGGLKTPNQHRGHTNMSGGYGSSKRATTALNTQKNSTTSSKSKNHLGAATSSAMAVGPRTSLLDQPKESGGMGTLGSNYSRGAVYVGGPKVMSSGPNLQVSHQLDLVHVVSKKDTTMIDMDYHKTLGTENDSREIHGPVPPMRDATFEQTGPKSFYTPMTPRTKVGAARYLFNDESADSQKKAEKRIETAFNGKFGGSQMTLGGSYEYGTEKTVWENNNLNKYGRRNGATMWDILNEKDE